MAREFNKWLIDTYAVLSPAWQLDQALRGEREDVNVYPIYLSPLQRAFQIARLLAKSLDEMFYVGRSIERPDIFLVHPVSSAAITPPDYRPVAEINPDGSARS
ncbi:MAG: hypothetical protein V3T30_04445 [Thermodesulfobacteriota bacterium]